MADGFTPLARLAVFEAREEARALGHRAVAPEHLLLALLKQDEGPAVEVLRSIGFPLALVGLRLQQRRLESQGFNLTEVLLPTRKTIPFATSTERVLKLAKREASQLVELRVDTHHLLSGIIEEGDNVAARVLAEFGVDLRRVRQPSVTGFMESIFARIESERRDGDRRGRAGHAATDTSLLPVREQSTAILIGAAHYADSQISDLPSVVANLTDLRDVLTDPGQGAFATDRVDCFPNPGLSDLPRIAELAAEPLDTLLLYYAGHGFLEDGLYLGLKGTEAAHIDFTALPYAQIRKMVLRSPSRRNLVILDCCYAGAAVEFMSDGTAGGELDIRGAYVLAATAKDERAHAPAGARNSAFTAALLRVLRDGVADGGPLIRMGVLHSAMTRLLRADGRPLPRQRATDTIGDLAIHRNRGWRGAATI
ncbi:Clp protease N-terminal domain-containing protein [Micromonospora sp. WMMD712]|uniref:caspase family protein n=1 Tax=Micromonospora sp. WMMD712 TaxID=3016096 RepID=UPI00249CED45|nr:Clp protease N-terminal domain-containing protein [Micromonospora sp. WMMD712]WFE59213.1 Clp protease N-terminal domain-containing protein [Micromonospora sp. WMMD712]